MSYSREESNTTSFVLHHPDFFLFELDLESFLFRLPEAEVAAFVAYLVDPMFVGKNLARRAQPGSLCLSLARPSPNLPIKRA